MAHTPGAIIKKLIAAGKTIVLATHHVNEIVPEMERVVLLKGGSFATESPTGSSPPRT